MTVANEIAKQIGGRAFFMMGTRHKLGGPNYLSFDIRGSRVYQKVQVTLEPDDTYKVEFFKFRKYEISRYEEVKGVYVDQLRGVISEHTGLALSL